jgi:GT2 family glycosyltransferase
MSGLPQIMKKPHSTLTGSSPGGEDISVPAVSFVVIGLNEERMIAACMRSVMDCDYPQDKKEIIYVDSGSTDRTLEIVQSLPSVSVIHLNDPQPNAAKGRNAGWRAARGEFIQFLDGDMVLQPDWPGFAHQSIAQLENLACVSGQVREYREPGNIYSIIFDRMWRSEIGETGTLGGAFLARRSALAEVNGFDESLKGCEEPDLATRILRTGRTIWCFSATLAVHHSGINSFKRYWGRIAAYSAQIEAWQTKMDGRDKLIRRLPRLTKDLLVSCLLPALVLMGALLHFIPLVALGVAGILAFLARITAREYRRSGAFSENLLYALHLFVAKYPTLWGRLCYKLGQRHSYSGAKSRV